MIRQFYIKHFRGIEDIHLEDIGKVNVFLGKNNCGKSTILDALYLLCYPVEPQHFIEINALRGYNSTNGEDFQLNFHNRDTKNPIVFEAEINGGIRHLDIYNLVSGVSEILITEGDTSRLKNKDYTVLYHLQTEDNVQYDTNLLVDHKEPQVIKVNQIDQFHNAIPVKYLTPSTPYREMDRLFAVAIKNKQEKYISEVMHAIDPRIIDVVIAGDEILVDVGSDQRIPLQLMGDGMRKIFSTIVNISMCKDGILLIDEIDNGLHYTSLDTLWRAIIECANKFNVQIFATTHNIESLEALNACLDLSEAVSKDDFRAYTIRQSSESNHVAIMSNYSQFNHVINQELELR